MRRLKKDFNSFAVHLCWFFLRSVSDWNRVIPKQNYEITGENKINYENVFNNYFFKGLKGLKRLEIDATEIPFSILIGHKRLTLKK